MSVAGTVTEAVGDGVTIIRRNLKKILRVPDILVFTLISPIMFVLLFAFVFGGAIGSQDTGVDYNEFLVPGIFVQTVVFGATFTGYSLAEDLQKGIIDRFRSLPMSPSAVLTGRTGADVGINILSLVVMALTGLVSRVADPHLGPRRGDRLPRHPGVRLRGVVGHGLRRAGRADAGGRQQRLVRGDLPGHVPGQHVRAHEHDARAALHVRRLEPGLGGGPVRAGALRQPRRRRDAVRRLAGAAREAYVLIWVVGLVAVFAPLSIRKYQNTASR